MANSSRKFTVALAEPDETSSRAVRRVLLNPDALKSLKLTTGDVVAVSQADQLQVRPHAHPFILAMFTTPLAILCWRDMALG
jgi:hypothetical protein